MSDRVWIDLVIGRASGPACDGCGYNDDGTDEGELCVVCDGRGGATAEDAERWLAEAPGERLG